MFRKFSNLVFAFPAAVDFLLLLDVGDDEQALDDRRRRRRKVVAGPEQLLEVLDDLVADLVRAGQVGVAGAGLQDPFAGSSLRTLVVLQEKIPISEQ